MFCICNHVILISVLNWGKCGGSQAPTTHHFQSNLWKSPRRLFKLCSPVTLHLSLLHLLHWQGPRPGKESGQRWISISSARKSVPLGLFHRKIWAPFPIRNYSTEFLKAPPEHHVQQNLLDLLKICIPDHTPNPTKSPHLNMHPRWPSRLWNFRNINVKYIMIFQAFGITCYLFHDHCT